MMHFDMRTLPIGRKINLCKSSAGGDSLKTHPYLKGAIDKKAVCTTTEKEDYDFNNEDYESWNEPESIDFEDKIGNYLNDESDFEVDSYKITDEFDEAYEGEIEEAYEGGSDEEIAKETEMDFEEINYNEELDQEPESDSHGVELEEEDIPQSTEVAISNEYIVDEKKGVTGYLNVSAIKNRPLRTGVFIPAGFTQNNSVDVILYLHGLFDYGSYKYGMAYYWKNYSNIREHFYLSNRNAILIAPALGSNPQVTDLIFKYQKGLDQFLSDCIKELIARNHLPAGAAPGKIILAAHSAGGYPMSVILRTENSLASNIVECWCFDCFYNYQWEKVLEKNSGKPFYHYWAYTYNGKMSGPGSRGEVLAKTYPNLKNIKPAAGIHHREVIEYAWKNEINKRSWFTPISVTSSTVNQEVNEWDGESADTKYNNLNQNKNTDYLTYDQFTNEERWNEMYENESNEASLMEGLLPAVSMNDIRTRLDDYLDQANAEYTLEDGTTIRARHTFAYGYGVTPVLDTLKRKIQTQLGSSIYNKLQQKSNPIITKALYGRAKPSELKLITQALIKSSSDIFADADDIRAHQREFRIGIDCAGYVQLAFFYSLYGHDNDTPARRKAVGLEEARGSERLENLGTANFTEVGILKAQPGDLMVMNPRQKSETDHSYLDSDHSMHTVIVVDHSKKGDVHEYLLDASWGNDAYGAKYGGVGRRTLCYDEVAKEWWDIHPGSGAKISGYKFVKAGSGWAIVGAQPGDPGFHSTAKIGPYLGHKIKGVYRPKLKAAPVKEISEANDFELMDESEFDSIHEESVPWNEAGSFHLMNPFRNQEEIENEFKSGNTFIDTVTKVTYGAVNIMQVITNLMKEGSDENTITDAILFIRHPELKNKKLTPNSSQVLKIEWLKIRDELVRPQLKKLKSQYQAQSVSDSKKQKDLASAIADFGKYRNFKDNILVWDLNGEGIFFEFEDGRLKYELSYPNEKNRIYYKQGDVILVNKVQADKLPSYFNSQSPDDSDDSISYLTVLLAFLNEGEQTEYELGYRVIHIFSYGKNSEVELKPLIKLENTWFEAEENINIPAYAYSGTLKDGSLSSRFWMARTSEHFHDVARILLIEAKVTKTLLSLYGSEVGEIVIKKILRWGAKKTIGAGIKKAIKYYFAQFVKGIPFIFLKGIKAFVLIIAKEILVMKIERNRLAQFQYYVKSEDFKPVIIRASEAMAVAMVNQLFEILVGDRVNRFFLNLLKSAKSSPDRLKSMLTGFLSKKIISLFTKDFANEIIGAVTEAYEESLQQKESFEELLLKKISQKVQEDFIDRLKSWTFEAVEDVSKGVIEIFER